MGRRSKSGHCSVVRLLVVAVATWTVVAVYVLRQASSGKDVVPSSGRMGSSLPKLRPGADESAVLTSGAAPPPAQPEVLSVKDSLSQSSGEEPRRPAWAGGHVDFPDDSAIAGSTWPPPDPRMLARRRQQDPAFPPKQPADQCKARGLRGGAADPNKKLLDRIQVSAPNEDGHTLFCMIYTISRNHKTAASTVRDTWASRCDGFVVMSDAEDPTLPAARVTHEGKEEYNNIWQKVRSIWKYVHAAYREEFDWFVIGGDDLFVVPSNLRAYVTSEAVQRASEGGKKPMFLGRRFQIPKGQLFNSGGAGYVLNREALDLLVDNLDNQRCRPHQHVFAEDVNVAHCLEVNGVQAFDTRDSNGGERFHPFTPGQHLLWRPPAKRRPDGSSPDWYENYNAPWGLKLGEDCCSPESVAFHYVKPDLMPHMSALLFDCRNGEGEAGGLL